MNMLIKINAIINIACTQHNGSKLKIHNSGNEFPVRTGFL